MPAGSSIFEELEGLRTVGYARAWAAGRPKLCDCCKQLVEAFGGYANLCLYLYNNQPTAALPIPRGVPVQLQGRRNYTAVKVAPETSGSSWGSCHVCRRQQPLRHLLKQ